jgi:hypothetical protein
MWGHFFKKTRRSLLPITSIVAPKSKYQEKIVDSLARYLSKPFEFFSSSHEVSVFLQSSSNGGLNII